MVKRIKDIKQEEPPMLIVGQFLEALFQVHLLPKRTSSSTFSPRSPPNYSPSHKFIQLLHYCPCFNRSQLIQTVIGICSGVPEAYEVFRCRPSTSVGELKLFLERAVRHSLRSIVLEVNRLPFKLQEVYEYFIHYLHCLAQ